MLNTSVEVICYKSKRLRDGTFPLMLRITKAGKRKYVALGVSVEERHWDFEKNKPKRNCPDKELIEKLIVAKETEYKETALELLANRREFTASSLAGKVERKVNTKTVKEMYEKIMNDLSAGGSFGNYTIYRYSYNSLMKFTHNSLDIPFMDIDEEWLKRYEKWLRRTCKDTTISIHFRTLRSVFNKALEADLIREESYPFKKFRLSRFDVTTRKRAIEGIRRPKEIAVLYNSVQQSRLAILNLKKNYQNECGIICSEASKDEAGEFYIDTGQEYQDRRITFYTGQNAIPPADKPLALIIVPDASRGSTTLSVKQIIRLQDAIGDKERLTRNIIIHNTFYCHPKDWEASFSSFIERGNRVAVLLNATEALAKDDKSLGRFFRPIRRIVQYKVGIRADSSR